MSDAVTFEYQDRGKETPFETFLRYTDEKVQSAKVLAEIIKKVVTKEGLDFLDIGSGNGEYLSLALNSLPNLPVVNFTLLEPSLDLFEELRNKSLRLPHKKTVEVVNQTWEEYESSKKFDVILASHLYHIPRSEYQHQLGKMITFLKDGGYLIFVMREKDDTYEYKKLIKSQISGEMFEAKTLDEAVNTFKEISEKEPVDLKIERFTSRSKLTIPISKNRDDAIAIIEFFVNKRWEEISPQIQEEALKFVQDKNEQFEQIDGIALIKKF